MKVYERFGKFHEEALVRAKMKRIQKDLEEKSRIKTSFKKLETKLVENPWPSKCGLAKTEDRDKS